MSSKSNVAHAPGCLCDRCLDASWRDKPKADDRIPYALNEPAGDRSQRIPYRLTAKGWEHGGRRG